MRVFLVKQFKVALTALTLVAIYAKGQPVQTYAERLGWKKNDHVIIFHVDDVGMSYESNQGAIQALENKLATSMSVMMPCPWVPGIVNYLQQHPGLDAGLHLTHTSEWSNVSLGSRIRNKSDTRFSGFAGCAMEQRGQRYRTCFRG